MSNLLRRLMRLEKTARPGRPTYEEYTAASRRFGDRLMLGLTDLLLEKADLVPDDRENLERQRAQYRQALEDDSPERERRDRDTIERWRGRPISKAEQRANTEQLYRKLVPELYERGRGAGDAG